MKENKLEHKDNTIADPIFGVIFNVLFLLLLNAFYRKINFLTDEFDKVMPYYNASLAVAIILQVSRIFVRNYGYKLVSDAISLIFFIIIAYQLWVIYPFDTSVLGSKSFWDIVFRILIIVPPVGLFIATAVKIWKFIIEECMVPVSDEKNDKKSEQ